VPGGGGGKPGMRQQAHGPSHQAYEGPEQVPEIHRGCIQGNPNFGAGGGDRYPPLDLYLNEQRGRQDSGRRGKRGQKAGALVSGAADSTAIPPGGGAATGIERGRREQGG